MPRILPFILLSLVFITACGEDGGSAELSTARDVKVTAVAANLEHPWAMTFLPDDEYLVSERRGKIWRIKQKSHKVEITGVPEVYEEGQGGLLDLALSPNFAKDGWLYFSYAAEDEEGNSNTEVARAKLDLRHNSLDGVEVIFQALPKVKGGNHWGSRLLFSPDGSLYITLGERFDYQEEAQNTHNHLGTVVRILPDGTTPPDNPFIGTKEAQPQIFSYGHRNIQGIALHPQTGKVWINEHGPKGGDEINILKAGANYGWPAVTHGVSYWGTKISDKTSTPEMEDPVLQWTPSIAPSGMVFYKGDAFPQWKGDLFVGALAKQHLRRIRFEGTKLIEQEELLTERESRIRDVREGPDGFLYVLTDENNGYLLRLEPSEN